MNTPIYILVAFNEDHLALGLRILPDRADGTIKKFKLALIYQCKKRFEVKPVNFQIYDVGNPSKYGFPRLIEILS